MAWVCALCALCVERARIAACAEALQTQARHCLAIAKYLTALAWCNTSKSGVSVLMRPSASMTGDRR